MAMLNTVTRGYHLYHKLQDETTPSKVDHSQWSRITSVRFLMAPEPLHRRSPAVSLRVETEEELLPMQHAWAPPRYRNKTILFFLVTLHISI